MNLLHAFLLKVTDRFWMPQSKFPLKAPDPIRFQKILSLIAHSLSHLASLTSWYYFSSFSKLENNSWELFLYCNQASKTNWNNSRTGSRTTHFLWKFVFHCSLTVNSFFITCYFQSSNGNHSDSQCTQGLENNSYSAFLLVEKLIHSEWWLQWKSHFHSKSNCFLSLKDSNPCSKISKLIVILCI